MQSAKSEKKIALDNKLPAVQEKSSLKQSGSVSQVQLKPIPKQQLSTIEEKTGKRNISAKPQTDNKVFNPNSTPNNLDVNHLRLSDYQTDRNVIPKSKGRLNAKIF